MRSVFTLSAILFLSISAFALNEGTLTITLPSDQFTVTVNGRIYTLYQNTVTLDNINAGEYRIKIYRLSTNNGNMRQLRQPLYSTMVQVKPNTHVDIMINRFGRIFLDEQYKPGSNTGRYDRGNDWRNKVGMPGQDFTQLLGKLKEIPFSDDKMVLIRDAALRNNFFAGQVTELMKQFSFENDKLELAKLLYSNIVDKNNFYLVYSELRFSSSRKELEEYIKNIRYH